MELRLCPESRNFTVHQCKFSASVQPVGVIFKISIVTKIVITQHARNHSDFYPRMAVLGFELMLPCYIFFLIAFLDEVFITNIIFVFFGGATALGGPWPPLQYASKPLDPLLYLSIRLFPSFSGPWTRHPAISFLVFLFVLLHTAFRTTFLELRCLAFFLYDQAIVLFGI